MAAAKTAILLPIAAAYFLLLTTTSAQATPPAPEPSASGSAPPGLNPINPDCFNTVLNMSDCLTFVTAGSTEKKPDKACCPELAGLLESAPICLCYLVDKNNAESLGFSIDLDKALNLPSACGLSAPAVSSCAGLGPLGPGGSPNAVNGNTEDSSGVENHAFTLSSVLVLLITIFVI